MTPGRLASLAVVLVASPALAAEKWADGRLPVIDGLEMWFDASRLPVARPKLEAGAKLDSWPDASGKKRDVKQALADARPVAVRAGDHWAVRFDGQDDHFRITGLGSAFESVTVFLVVAPHSNPGGFCGFCAANAKDRRDYESGFTIDQGPFGTATFSQLNLEGRGFGGAANLMKSSGSFGTLHVLEALWTRTRKLPGSWSMASRPAIERSIQRA